MSGRIDDKLAQLRADQATWSVEYFPPKTSEGLANLFARAERMITGLAPASVSYTHLTLPTKRIV